MVNTRPLKNLWVAASDGDIERVKELVATEGYNANSPDENSYTPMHAAASYAHLDLLEYLLSIGGDINITDNDGETPLFTVESIETARHLISKGADISLRNHDGLTAAETLMEDFPDVAVFLISLNPSSQLSTATDGDAGDRVGDAGFSDMLAQAQAVMSASEADGSDPDARLRAIVSHALQGGGLGVADEPDTSAVKRQRNE